MTHWFKAALLYILPHHLFSRIVQWSTRWRHLPLCKPFARWFVRHYNVDMSEAIQPDLYVYPDFNSFFTRALRPETRPIAQGKGQICCPSDGAISQLEKGEELGRFNMGGSTIIILFGPGQVKWQPGLGARSRVQFGQVAGEVVLTPN